LKHTFFSANKRIIMNIIQRNTQTQNKQACS
jgi:hypothetical protein